MSPTPAQPERGQDLVIEDLTALGGFFTLVAAPPAHEGAVAWREVLAEDALAARFTQVRAALATGSELPEDEVDPKVAVSATQVGLASRLWSVALASAVVHGWVPDLSPDGLVASPVHRGPVPLGVRDPARGYAVPTLAEAVSVIGTTVVDGSLTLLDEACARAGRTPAKVLVSNDASALVGAARVLARHRPEHGARAWELARALLRHPYVTAGGEVRPKADLHHCVGGAMELREEAFLRTGCCVFYRLPGHGLCPDCVLAPSRPEQVTDAH